jgi:cytochrome c peroxidase
LGVGHAAKEYDQGRRKISGIEGDHGAFRTPTLREIARTAPYMHDGSLKTLEEVVDYYNQGGTKNDYLDEEIYALKLTDAEKKALVTFLKEGLASPGYPDIAAPELP